MAQKWLEIDQDNMRIKFLTLNVSFNNSNFGLRFKKSLVRKRKYGHTFKMCAPTEHACSNLNSVQADSVKYSVITVRSACYGGHTLDASITVAAIAAAAGAAAARPYGITGSRLRKRQEYDVTDVLEKNIYSPRACSNTTVASLSGYSVRFVVYAVSSLM